MLYLQCLTLQVNRQQLLQDHLVQGSASLVLEQLLLPSVCLKGSESLASPHLASSRFVLRLSSSKCSSCELHKPQTNGEFWLLIFVKTVHI